MGLETLPGVREPADDQERRLPAAALDYSRPRAGAGATPSVPGFYLNCGYWAGVMLAAGAGRRVADLATGKLDPKENALRPTRYAEGIIATGDSFLRGHH